MPWYTICKKSDGLYTIGEIYMVTKLKIHPEIVKVMSVKEKVTTHMHQDTCRELFIQPIWIDEEFK